MTPQDFTRRGFTLIEVALAVSVGLTVFAVVVLGYNVLRDQESSASARKRVGLGLGVLQEYAATNGGLFPPSVPGATGGAFSSLWVRKMPDSYNVSPWGGPTTDVLDGVRELAPITDGTPDSASAPDKTSLLVTDGSQAANMIYVSMPGSSYAKVAQLSNPNARIVRGFILSIYDRAGQPWFHVASNL